MSINILYNSFLSDSLGYYKVNPECFVRRFCGILVTDYKIARTEFPYACAQAMSVNILYDSFLSDSLGYYKVNPFNVL